MRGRVKKRERGRARRGLGKRSRREGKGDRVPEVIY